MADVEPDGSAVISKPPGTGGMVTFDTVREQLLYEVHNPAQYFSPDVVADFTSLTLDDLGDDRVRVSGTRAADPPSTDTYKGLVCTPAGWAAEARLAYSWPDAEAKARAALAFLRKRADENDVPIEEWREEYFGVNAFGGPTVDNGVCEPPEVIGRLAWRTSDRESAGRVAGEVGVLGLSGPPTIAGTGRGRGDGRPSQLLAVEPFYVDKKLVDDQVRVEVEEV